MKKVFFELLKVFAASRCAMSNLSGKTHFYPEGEVWASFTSGGMFGLTGNRSNSKYNGTPTIVYGNLKERELLQLESLFRQAAAKEERINYKEWLLNAASEVRFYWHLNFQRHTDAWKINQLELRLEEAQKNNALLQARVEYLESQLQAEYGVEPYQYDQE